MGSPFAAASHGDATPPQSGQQQRRAMPLAGSSTDLQHSQAAAGTPQQPGEDGSEQGE
jgi:hypothetical protein